MNTLELKTFVSVVSSGSFTLAADTLHLSQPAISKRIKSLEEQLGVKLIDRLNRDIELTENGKRFLPHAIKIIDACDDAAQSLSDDSDSISGSLEISSSHYLGLHRLPIPLAKYRYLYPDVELKFNFKDSESIYYDVLNGHLAFGLVTLPETIDPALEAAEIWTDQMKVVTSVNHPLQSINTINAENLLDYPAILTSKSTFTRNMIEQQFTRHKLTIKQDVEANSLEIIQMLVSIGLGWSVLPDKMISTDLKTLDVNDFNHVRPLGLVYLKKRTMTKAAIAFSDLLHATANA